MVFWFCMLKVVGMISNMEYGDRVSVVINDGDVVMVLMMLLTLIGKWMVDRSTIKEGK